MQKHVMFSISFHSLKMLFQKTYKYPYFILLVILLKKMMAIVKMCYWIILISTTKSMEILLKTYTAVDWTYL